MKRYISCFITALLICSLSLIPAVGTAKTPIQMQVYYQNPLATAGVETKTDRVQMSYSSTKLLVAQRIYSVVDPTIEMWSFKFGSKEVTPEKFVELWLEAANSPNCDAGCNFSISGNWNGCPSNGSKAFWAANMPSKTQRNVNYDKIVWKPVSNAEKYRVEYIDNEGRMCVFLVTLDKAVTSLSLDQIMDELGKRVVRMPADGKVQLQISALNKAGVSINSSAIFTVDLSSKMISTSIESRTGANVPATAAQKEVISGKRGNHSIDEVVPYDLWQQDDDGWRNEVGDSGNTISATACFSVSMGIVAGIAGVLPENVKNPYDWLKHLQKTGVIVDGNWGPDYYYKISDATNGGVSYEGTSPNTAVDNIDVLLKNGYLLIAKVPSSNPYGQHFVVITRIENDMVYMINPSESTAPGERIFSEGYDLSTIIELYLFKAVN